MNVTIKFSTGKEVELTKEEAEELLTKTEYIPILRHQIPAHLPGEITPYYPDGYKPTCTDELMG